MKEDWINCKLGDLLKLKNGFAFKSSKYTKEGIPVLRIGDIYDWNVNTTEAQRVKEETEYDSYIVNKGDILIAMSGATTGKFGIYKSEEKAYQNQRVGNLIPYSKKFLDKNFVFYLLYSLKREIEKEAYGGAQPNISAIKIEALNTTLAPLPFQRAIVLKIENLFASLDKGIADLKTAQEQLKVYRQAVLKKAFEGKFTHSEKDFISEKNNGELPKSWNWATIYDYIIDNKKGMTTGPFGTALKKSEHTTEGIPVLGIENIGEGTFLMPNKIFVTSDKAKELESFRVLANDIIISRSGTVGEICSVPSNMANSLISTNLIRVRLNLLKISPKFFVYLFQGGNVREQVKDLCKGSTRVFLNQTILKGIKLPYCSIEEQNNVVKEIESRLSVCDKVEQSIAEALEKAEALRQSILKKAFEGKLLSEAEIAKCKQEADYESASELLKKIKAEKK